MNMKVTKKMMKSNLAKTIMSVILLMTIASCSSGEKTPPIKFPTPDKEIVIPYKEVSGVPTIPVKINGVSMQMIYDTGASHISMSLNEVLTLCKLGEIRDSDIIGTDSATLADGSTIENVRVRLREVEIGGENGIKVHNVEATIVPNLAAPLLLGRSAIEKDRSVTSVSTDMTRKTIVIKRK